MAFRCTSLDIITAYCLDTSLNALDTPDFQHPFITSLKRAIPFFWVLKYLPALTKPLMDPPQWLMRFFPHHFRGIFDFRHQIASQLDYILANPTLLRDTNRKVIYSYLLDPSDDLKSRPSLSTKDLFQEALALLLAGSDTVGNTCTVGFANVLSNPPVLQKLVGELKRAFPDEDDPMTLEALEKLPYLVSLASHTISVWLALKDRTL